MVQSWIKTVCYDDIKTKWDADMCMKFLMLSETTQKKLPGAPKPSKPCSVKDIVCARLEFLLGLGNNPVNSAPQIHHETPIDIPLINSIIETFNLVLTVIRLGFPSYPIIIIPVSSFTTIDKFNQDIKIFNLQLRNLVTWVNNHQVNTIPKTQLDTINGGNPPGK